MNGSIEKNRFVNELDDQDHLLQLNFVEDKLFNENEKVSQEQDNGDSLVLTETSDKILAFISICLLGFGAYYSYDSVSALQPHFLT
ncbi:MAG: Major facilitator superfamily domain-containing protein 1, partial [Paramarteilia canceri]